MPIFHVCQRCAACCRWPGQVRVDEAEITRLAAFLEVSEHDFIQRFTRLSADRSGLALTERPGGDCIFLTGGDCAVQSVKPQLCRAFPNGWNFPGFERLCQARPEQVSEEEYRERFAVATGHQPKTASQRSDS